MKSFLFSLTFMAAAYGIGVLIESLRMRDYWKRGCMGAEWRRRFPHATRQDIRRFLTLLVDAFALGPVYRLRFSPDDRLMNLYRTLNPPGWSAGDSMELETFSCSFEEAYGIDCLTFWKDDITLSELFSLSRGCVHGDR